MQPELSEKPSDALARAVAKAKREQWEDLFAAQLRASRNLECAFWAREWQFDQTRKWRFDFCFHFPDTKKKAMVAVEIEGLSFGKSRHTTNGGYSKDLEKYNRAAELGWTVGRFTQAMVKSGEALRWTESVIKSILEGK